MFFGVKWSYWIYIH